MYKGNQLSKVKPIITQINGRGEEKRTANEKQATMKPLLEVQPQRKECIRKKKFSNNFSCSSV